ncbi:S26 family signal peptidase [Burkholderia cenocepacia]|uniref:S26 family signal peptidase n=1 Tax=Burkholderia cenocepacia TaxID=95486 RepID=UPI0007621DDE|nr:S26 family signal peptidase [Burkholderia cenocepacia]KWU17821.1 hypothetical protein AS149_13960 [Burkholderia cenocepacia]
MITRRTLEQFFIGLAAATLSIVCYVRFVPYSVVWNITASIPKGLYFSTEYDGSKPLAHRQIGCFDYKAPKWADARHYFPENFQLCKYVYGVPGDLVVVSDKQVSVSDGFVSIPGGVIAPADSRGRPLPQDVAIAGEVPKGEYLMLAPEHNNSLDSRYLGRIAQSRITRTLVPLVTW